MGCIDVCQWYHNIFCTDWILDKADLQHKRYRPLQGTPFQKRDRRIFNSPVCYYELGPIRRSKSQIINFFTLIISIRRIAWKAVYLLVNRLKYPPSSQRNGYWNQLPIHMFHILLEYHNHSCVLGFSGDLFHILHNIPTSVGITYRGGGFKCGIYAFLFLIYVRIGMLWTWMMWIFIS